MAVTLDDIVKNRKKIAKILRDSTNGEIHDIDFIIDYVSTGRPILTFLIGVPAKVKKQYGGDMDELINRHEETIRQVVSSFGFYPAFTRTIKYSVL